MCHQRGCRPTGRGFLPSWALRGFLAVAAGLVTPAELRGLRFRRLFPDVYAPADREPGLALRSVAAFVYGGRRGVVVGYSAAELLESSCAPAGAPAEVTCSSAGSGRRPVSSTAAVG